VKGKTTLFLLIAVLLVGGVTWYAERHLETRDRHLDRARMAFRIDAQELSYIRFEKEETVVECERLRDGQWMLRRPVNARADAGEIDRLITRLQELPLGETVTGKDLRAKGLTHADYGLGRPRARLTLGDGKDRTTYRVGRDAPLGDFLYLREEQSTDIISTSKQLLELFPADIDALRDRVLVHGEHSRIHRLDLRRDSGFLQLQRRDEGGWMIQQPFVGRGDPAKIREITDALIDVRVSEFIADGVTDTAAYGLTDKGDRVSIWMNGEENPVNVLMGNAYEKNEELRYALVEGEQSVVAVPRAAVQPLQAPADSIRDRRLFTLPAAAISRVVLEREENVLELAVNTNRVWEILRPARWPADPVSVERFLGDWAGLTIRAFYENTATNLFARAETGTPVKVLFFTGNGGKEDIPAVQFRVAAGSLPDGLFLVRVEPDGPYYGLENRPVLDRHFDALQFRNKEVLALKPENIQRITIRREDRECAVEKNDKNVFIPPEGNNRQIDNQAVLNLLGLVSRLRVKAFVTEAAPDLSAYGLDPPRTVLTLGLSGEIGINKVVLIGAPAGEQGIYGTVRGLDTVFVLEKAVAGGLTRDLFLPDPTPDEATHEKASDAEGQ
jgi:hypothetical protein